MIIVNSNKNYCSSIISGHLPGINIHIYVLLFHLIKVNMMAYILYSLSFSTWESFLRTGLQLGWNACPGLLRTFLVLALNSASQFWATDSQFWCPVLIPSSGQLIPHFWATELSSLFPKMFSVISYMWTVVQLKSMGLK